MDTAQKELTPVPPEKTPDAQQPPEGDQPRIKDRIKNQLRKVISPNNRAAARRVFERLKRFDKKHSGEKAEQIKKELADTSDHPHNYDIANPLKVEASHIRKELAKELENGTTGVEKEGSKGSEVTMLQWNVWHKANPAEVTAHLKNLCKEQNVDIVCLQELSQFATNNTDITDLPKYIAEQLGKDDNTDWNYVVVPARYLNIGKKEYSADDIGIFTKLPIERQESQGLSQNGFRVFKERQEGQNYLAVDVRIPGTDKVLTVATTHLLTPHLTKRHKRIEEANKLGEIASDNADKPFVLTGDFNAGPRSHAARKVQESLNRTREPGTPTWNARKWKSFGPFRILLRKEYDQTYASEQVKVTDSRVLNEGPSDHRPTVTKMEIFSKAAGDEQKTGIETKESN